MPSGARGVEASRALAASAYRSLIRAVSGPRARGATAIRAPSDASDASPSSAPSPPSSPPPISTRARGVLLDRARVLARAAAAADPTRADAPSRRRAFIARCLVAATFFNRAHADPSGVEARHARAAVGYLDGAAKRRRLVEKRAASRRALRAARVRSDVSRALDDAFERDRAAAIGFPRGLFPSSVDVERARAS